MHTEVQREVQRFRYCCDRFRFSCLFGFSCALPFTLPLGPPSPSHHPPPFVQRLAFSVQRSISQLRQVRLHIDHTLDVLDGARRGLALKVGVDRSVDL